MSPVSALPRRVAYLFVTVVALLSSGCGSLSLPGDPIYGGWQLESDDPNRVIMIFTPDGNFTMVLPGNLETVNGAFTVDRTEQPAYLDIDLGENGRVATIIDFPEGGVMRMADSQPGLPRPTSFDNGFATFVRRGGETAAGPADELPSAATTSSDIPAGAEQYSRGSNLANLLRYVPNTPVYRRYLTFGDYAAWLDAWEIPAPANIDEVASMADAERSLWTFVMGVQTSPPAALGRQYIAVESMADQFGFDLFTSEQYLEAGQLPELLTVIAPGDRDGTIGLALAAAGYEAVQENEAFVRYTIREDNEIDLASPSSFGRMGELNRIAASDEVLIIGKATSIVTDAITTAQDGSTLADLSAYQALLRSLDAPALEDAGALVGMIFQTDLVPIDMAQALLGNNPSEEILAQWDMITSQEPPLPQYLLVGLATYRAPDVTFLAVHAVFLNSDVAETAAAVLASRLDGYVSSRTNEPHPWSVADGFADGKTAVVLLRLDDEATQPGGISWFELVMMRDLAFLVTE